MTIHDDFLENLAMQHLSYIKRWTQDPVKAYLILESAFASFAERIGPDGRTTFTEKSATLYFELAVKHHLTNYLCHSKN